MYHKEFDIIVTGAGLSGLFLANMLAYHGFKIALVEKSKIQELSDSDIRTTAINLAACQVMENCGLWDELRESSSKISDIMVINNLGKAELHFNHGMVMDQPMGYILKNSQFKNAMLKKAKNEKNITIFDEFKIENTDRIKSMISITSSKKEKIDAKLILAAQGKFSEMLKEYKVDILRHEYKQTSLTFLVRHNKPHLNLAVEHFLPNGPVATLPLKGQFTSSVVWSIKEAEATRVMALDNEAKEELLNQYLPKCLGEANIISEIQAFPLTSSFALKYYRDRFLFIGDSVHSMHPLAGQGFNLTIMDISKLVVKLKSRQSLGLDIGTTDIMKEFVSSVLKDDAIMVGSMSLLNALFSNNNIIIDKARSIGLQTVDNITPIKKSIVAYAMGIR